MGFYSRRARPTEVFKLVLSLGTQITRTGTSRRTHTGKRAHAHTYVVDQRIKFYSQNTNLLPPKPKSTFRHLKQGIQDFHRKYVLVPADKAANNVVVV